MTGQTSVSGGMGDMGGMRELIIGLLWGLLVCLLLTMMCGCRSVKYVSVPEYHTVYKTRTDSVVKKDSVFVHDSISTWIKGDTVFRDRWHTEWRNHNTDKLRIDTMIQTDSVRVPYPVEKRLSKWQQAKQDYFVPLACGFAIILLTLLWLIKRRL